MTTISMDLVKKLREKTQIGMMDCKKALVQADGDMDKAIEILRKKGTAVAAKRADNATDNGRISTWISNDFRTGSLIEVACETDFSANTQDMLEFSNLVAEVSAKTNISDANEILTQKSLKNEALTVNDHLNELIAKIAESIKISRTVIYNGTNNSVINAYIHPGSTIGAMVEIEADKEITITDELKSVARDICMQIAVTKPLSVKSSELDPSLVEKERAIATEQLTASNKPAHMIEKIVEGKLNKFYEEVCLENQIFIKDEKIKISEYLKNISNKVGANLTVKQFVRFGIGR